MKKSSKASVDLESKVFATMASRLPQLMLKSKTQLKTQKESNKKKMTKMKMRTNPMKTTAIMTTKMMRQALTTPTQASLHSKKVSQIPKTPQPKRPPEANKLRRKANSKKIMKKILV